MGMVLQEKEISYYGSRYKIQVPTYVAPKTIENFVMNISCEYCRGMYSSAEYSCVHCGAPRKTNSTQSGCISSVAIYNSLQMEINREMLARYK